MSVPTLNGQSVSFQRVSEGGEFGMLGSSRTILQLCCRFRACICSEALVVIRVVLNNDSNKRHTLGCVVECVVLGFSHCLISPPHQPPTPGAHPPLESFLFTSSFLVQGRRVVELASQLAKLPTFLTVGGNASSLPVSRTRNRSGGQELNPRMINQATMPFDWLYWRFRWLLDSDR